MDATGRSRTIFGALAGSGTGQGTSAQALTNVVIKSTPSGAEIYVDQDFVGNTPSTIGVRPGKHSISIKKHDFQEWLREVTFSSGSIALSAELIPNPAVDENEIKEQVSQHATTSLEGSVFLITKEGDLKPARLAKVGLLPTSADTETIIKAANVAASALSDARSRKQNLNLIEGLCLKGLAAMAKPIIPLLPDRTDEMGKLSLQGVLPGQHTLIVFGRGGMNAALWISAISIEAGKTNSIKMTAPIVGCFDPDHTLSSF